MNALAEEFSGRVRFVVVEADRKGQVLRDFGFGSFPAYLVFRDGQEVDRLSLAFMPFFFEGRLRSMVADALE